MYHPETRASAWPVPGFAPRARCAGTRPQPACPRVFHPRLAGRGTCGLSLGSPLGLVTRGIVPTGLSLGSHLGLVRKGTLACPSGRSQGSSRGGNRGRCTAGFRAFMPSSRGVYERPPLYVNLYSPSQRAAKSDLPTPASADRPPRLFVFFPIRRETGNHSDLCFHDYLLHEAPRFNSD